MQKYHPIWLGLGFFIIPLFVLIAGYINIHPEMFRSIPSSFGTSSNAEITGIAWRDDQTDNPPLEYVSDSFKGTLISTEIVEVTSFWSLWNRPKSQIEYSWEYVVKNISDQKREIRVTYELQDRNGAVQSTSSSSEIADPGETITLTGTSKIDYDRARLVRDSGWRIGNIVVP